MSKIYSYAEYQKVAKVGDVVRAVEIVKTWETLKVGDYVITSQNEKLKVLAVLDGVFLFSQAYDLEACNLWITKFVARANGWTIVQDEVPEEVEEEVEEVTLEQVIEKFGKKVTIKQ